MSDQGIPPTNRVLIITAEPDERDATGWLRKVHDAFNGRPDTVCETWFLRDYWKRRWPGTRSVDSLRTWWINRILTMVGLHQVAAFARGRRLKAWFGHLDPTIAILDDGYGARLLPSAPHAPVLVVRRNPEAGNDSGFEEPPMTSGDLTIAHLRSLGGDDSSGRSIEVLPPPVFGDRPADLEFGRMVRSRERAPLPVPAGVPLVVGWGDDGWVDGSDLFVRTLWFLEHHQGIVAHGLWLGPTDDAIETTRITAEAELCGLADRVHLAADDPVQRWKGDVALLPRRVPVDLETIALAGATEVPLVTFEPEDLPAPWLASVPFLDLAAAAEAVATALGPELAERSVWSGELGWHLLVAHLLDLVDERPRT